MRWADGYRSCESGSPLNIISFPSLCYLLGDLIPRVAQQWTDKEDSDFLRVRMTETKVQFKGITVSQSTFSCDFNHRPDEQLEEF